MFNRGRMTGIRSSSSLSILMTANSATSEGTVNTPSRATGVTDARLRPQPLGDDAAAQRAADDRRLASLMQAAQDGDRVAYAGLLRELVPLLQRLVRARLHFLQPTDREDLVQDILLSLHAARATYDPRRPFMPWLVSIARHRMVDRARRHSRLWANEVLVDEFADSIADGASELPDSEYGDPEQVRQAVKGLPAGQRTAIELLKLRELSLREAADLSGMSISALKVATHRAIKSLRGVLA
jgi:RNA polymerase sigma-70 factor (ECF subfamily)